MREILFRGKREDNGEWVEGYYIYETDECSFELHLISDNKSVVTEVVPETVGQYTGLIDKNGKKIFEGDIIRVEHDLWHGENKKTRESDIGVVLYNTNTAEFGVKINGYSNCLTLRRWKGDFNEVIGNIHDNPEPLEGGEQNGENHICKRP